MTKNKSPLSNLLFAAFGDKTAEAAEMLDKMETGRKPVAEPVERPLPALVAVPDRPAAEPDGVFPSETPAPPSHVTSLNTSNKPSCATTGATLHDTTHSTLHNTSGETLHNPSHDTSDVASHVPTDDTSDEASDRLSLNITNTTLHDTSLIPRHDTSLIPRHEPSLVTSHNTSHEPYDIFDPVNNLNHRQGTVLYYLLHRPGYIAQRQQISAATGIPLPTIRDNIVCLTNENFITKPVKFVHKSFQGFTYTVNEELCGRFLTRRGFEFDAQGTSDRASVTTSHSTSDYPTHTSSHSTSDGALDGSSDGLSDVRARDYMPLEEERALNLTSSKTIPSGMDGRHTPPPTYHMTGGQPGRQTAGTVLSDPEHLYWKDLGLNEKKVASWMKETEMTADEMDTSLRYARFNFLKDPAKIKSPIDLFYTMIKRDGCVLRSPDYKSLRQIRTEQMQAERERRRQEDMEEEKLELDMAFDKIFQDKEGTEFKRLQAQVGRAGGMVLSGKMLEAAMREEFLKKKGATA